MMVWVEEEEVLPSNAFMVLGPALASPPASMSLASASLALLSLYKHDAPCKQVDSIIRAYERAQIGDEVAALVDRDVIERDGLAVEDIRI